MTAPLQVDGQQHVLLEGAQALVAVALEDLLQGGMGAYLDIQVGIDKAQAAELGQHHTHGALAGAGHADEADGCCHLLAGRQLGAVLSRWKTLDYPSRRRLSPRPVALRVLPPAG